MLAIFLLLLLSSLAPTLSLPPSPPVRCGGGGETGCVLSNAYGAWSSDRADCPVAAVAYPASERDVVAAVVRASAKNMRVKVVSGFAHTIPKLACPGGGNSSTSLLISTARYAGVEVDVGARTVTADAGAPLRAVIDAVEERGLSLPAAPYWEGVSIGGLVSTGSHGSSWWGRGGAVHDHMVGLSLVVPSEEADGWARVVVLEKGDALFPAALVSLGLLGVVSKVTLALEPRFKRSITYFYRDDSTFQDDFADHAASHEFADIAWYPSQHQAVYRIDDRAPLNATGDGVNNFIGFQSTLVAVSSGIRALETALERSKNVRGKCTMAAAEIAAKRLVGNGLRNGLLFTGYPVVGFQGKMQTSGSCVHSPASDLLSACAWDPRFKGLFFYESTAVFSPARFRDFILDVKRLRDLNPENFCGVDIYNGLLIRFVKRSDAYLGQPEDSVVVDFNSWAELQHGARCHRTPGPKIFSIVPPLLQLLPRVRPVVCAAQPGRVGGGGAAGLRQARGAAALGQKQVGGLPGCAEEVPGLRQVRRGEAAAGPAGAVRQPMVRRGRRREGARQGRRVRAGRPVRLLGGQALQPEPRVLLQAGACL